MLLAFLHFDDFRFHPRRLQQRHPSKRFQISLKIPFAYNAWAFKFHLKFVAREGKKKLKIYFVRFVNSFNLVTKLINQINKISIIINYLRKISNEENFFFCFVENKIQISVKYSAIVGFWLSLSPLLPTPLFTSNISILSLNGFVRDEDKIIKKITKEK